MAKQKLNTFGRVRALEGWKAVAFGAALLGSVAGGEFDSVSQACEAMKISADVVDPNPSWVPIMASTLSRYRDLYPALLGTNREAAAAQIDA